jgi:hypothetical protein
MDSHGGVATELQPEADRLLADPTNSRPPTAGPAQAAAGPANSGALSSTRIRRPQERIAARRKRLAG